MNKILEKIFFRGINLDIKKLHRKVVGEIQKIRHELDEHLQAINESANEITANYEYTCGLERKLDKLSERLDQIQMYLEASSGVSFARKTNFDVKRLNRQEQEVFLVIYTLEEEKGGVTYEDIAAKLSISTQLAGDYITSLIEKGVPIQKKYVNLKPVLNLNSDFKTLQAKENILQLSLREFI